MIQRKQRVEVRRGFTLMEVLVVVAIIVVLAGIAAPIVLNRLEEAKVDRARIDCKAISDACSMYNLKNGDYPQSLDVLVQPPEGGGKPYLPESALTDPWGKRYQLRTPGSHRENASMGRPDVFTVTKDGEEVGNWPKGQ